MKWPGGTYSSSKNALPKPNLKPMKLEEAVPDSKQLRAQSKSSKGEEYETFEEPDERGYELPHYEQRAHDMINVACAL